jgi:DNA ligase-1
MNESAMTLARDWDYRDLSGFYWSEKFDGCRAYWDGHCFWTRGGHVVDAPASALRQMPDGVELDGELWCGRGTLVEAANAVRHGLWTDNVRFVAFDAPGQRGDWMRRMAFADAFKNDFVLTVERGVVEHREHASDIAAAIIAAGGEGAMFRNPAALDYRRKRTLNLIRIKAGNLYAPWRKPEWTAVEARNYSDTGSTTRQKPAYNPRGKTAGLDVNLFPFDPAINHRIETVLG